VPRADDKIEIEALQVKTMSKLMLKERNMKKLINL
jgi:hypothetical protein